MPGPDDPGGYRPAGGDLSTVPARGRSGREHRANRRVDACHRSASALDGRLLSPFRLQRLDRTVRAHADELDWSRGPVQA